MSPSGVQISSEEGGDVDDDDDDDEAENNKELKNRRVKLFMKKHGTKFFVILPIIGGINQVFYGSWLGTCSDLLGSPIWGGIMSTCLSCPFTFCIALTSLKKEPSIKEGSKNVCKWVSEKWYYNMWGMIGGICGAVYAVLSSYVPKMGGLGMFFVFNTVGQIMGSVLVDATGFLWVAKLKLIWLSYVAAAMVIVGSIIYDMTQFLDLEQSAGDLVLTILLSTAGGLIIIIQAAGNAQVARVGGGTRRVLAYSFFTQLLFFLIVLLPFNPHPDFAAATPSDWWKFLCGICAALGLSLVLIAPLFLGYAMTYCYMMTSQLIMSLIWDNYGWMGKEIYKADTWRICGCVVVAASAALMQYSKTISIKRNNDKDKDLDVDVFNIAVHEHQHEEEEEDIQSHISSLKSVSLKSVSSVKSGSAIKKSHNNENHDEVLKSLSSQQLSSSSLSSSLTVGPLEKADEELL